MSLDVYLRCPTCDGELYHGNVTHNLARMARAAGLYEVLWQPRGGFIAEFVTADMLAQPLQAGLRRLEAEPERYRGYNPRNGWGSYDGLVAFVRAYLAACRRHPTALVRVSA